MPSPSQPASDIRSASDHQTRRASETTRRGAIQAGAAVTAVLAAAAEQTVHAAAGDPDPNRKLKLGLIGCGGRGTGATNDSLTINENVELVAVADVNPAKCKRTVSAMTRRHKDKVNVAEDQMHGGLDAYQNVIDNPEVDIVLVASPPGFHPVHAHAAVNAGKHVFVEKPSCVDAAGFQLCVKTHDQAVKNGTAIVTGTQYRRQTNYVAAVEKIREGMIGDIVSATTRYCSSGIWFRNRKEDMSDVQYQLYNWMHFNWLSGDQICEQAVHNIDTINWVMGGPPETAYGSGGRFTRPEGSEMWDSMSVDYMYPGNRTLSFACRQIPGTQSDNGNVIYGTKGICYIAAISGGSRITDRDGKELWAMKGSIADAYRAEHKALVDSVRSGEPIVELKETAESSLTAVMGRVAAYTGKRVKFDFMSTESKLDLFPKDLRPDSSLPKAQHAIPGKTKLV